MYKLIKKSTDCKARAAIISTSRCEIETPVFMPVGTAGTVKAVEQRVLEELEFRIILGNTYHLYLRPGMSVIEDFNGLHKFMNWNRNILTDSGGYQVFSLKELRKLTETGVEFKSHIDGSRHLFTPEKVVEIQKSLGSDIVMVLDECTEYPTSWQNAKESMDLSLQWALRSKNAFINSEPKYDNKQFLFGICQGSMFHDLRIEYLKNMIDIEFDGYALGGLSVGEPAEEMYAVVDVCTQVMPEDKPRYLMGVGTPENILEGIELGIDMFDCVLPTRNARNGQLFTTRGKINIRNSKYQYSHELIDENIQCYASQNFTLGYLRHLFVSGEILALQLATQHNLAFYKWLVETAREQILEDNYKQWKKNFLLSLNSQNE